MAFSFHSTSRLAWSCVFLLAAAAGQLMPRAHAEDVDLSTPKKAGVAFAKAMQSGDMQTVRKVATGSDEHFTAVKNYSDLFAAMKQYEAAAIKKFGAEGKLPAGAWVDLGTAAEKSEEKIEGDTATLTSPGQRHPIKLKKDGSTWKVDLMELDPEMMQMSPKVRKAADAISDVAKNVEAGKYETASEALMALGRVMQSLRN